MVGMETAAVISPAELPGQAFEHQGEAAGVLQGLGLGEQPGGGRGGAPLDLEAAELGQALGGEPDVALDRDAGPDHGAHGLDVACALDLDRPGAAVGQQAHCVGHGLFHRDLVGAEGHVGHDQGAAGGRSHRPGVMEHLLHGHGQGVGAAEDDHGQGVADQDHVRAGLFHQPGRWEVVGGDHGQPAGALGRADIGSSQLFAHGVRTARAPAATAQEDPSACPRI